jgi:hypothetical protein
MNENLNERAAQVEAAGKQRFGDNWSKFISALGRRGVTQLTNAIQRPDTVEMPFEPNAMRKKKKAAEAALEDFHGSLR